MIQLEWLRAAVRYETSCAGGPGGQHVNRTRSRVSACLELKVSEEISAEALERIRQKLAGRISQEGILRVSAEGSRSQEENREQALSVMLDLLRKAMTRPKKRIATRKTRASQQRRVDDKKSRAHIKQGRKNVDRSGF